MSAIGAVQPSTAVVATPVAPAAATAAPILPGADRPSMGQMQDAMASLYEALCKMRDAQVSTATQRVDAAKAQRDAAVEAEKAARQRAKEAAESGGFFDWVSKDIGLAGAVGLVSFDYGLVAADVAAHKIGLFDHVEEKVDLVDVAAVAATMATGRWEVLAGDALLRKTDLAPAAARQLVEDCGVPKDAPGISKKDIEPVAKKLLLANLLIASVAASILSCGTTGGLVVAVAGAAISYGGTVVAEKRVFDGVLGDGSSRWIGLGMGIYGAAASSMSGFAGGAPLVSSNAARGAALAAGTCRALEGADDTVSAVNDHRRDVADVDAEHAQLELKRVERVLDLITDGIEAIHQSYRKATATLQDAIATANSTELALASGVRG